MNISEVNFVKLVADYEEMLLNVSPDCYLGGFQSLAVQELFANNGIARGNIAEVAKIMTSFIKPRLSCGHYISDLDDWIALEKERIVMRQYEIDYINLPVK